jgi:hypothetical protein
MVTYVVDDLGCPLLDVAGFARLLLGFRGANSVLLVPE